MREPTDRQREVLTLVRDYISINGYPPTQRELAAKLGIKSATAVSDILAAAEKKGLVRLIPFISRGIQLTAEGLLAIEVAPIEEQP